MFLALISDQMKSPTKSLLVFEKQPKQIKTNLLHEDLLFKNQNFL